MVEIRLDVDKYGHLTALGMRGHAGSLPEGSNLACAALSLLIRSVARLLESRFREDFIGKVAIPGSLSFDIRRKFGNIDRWLLGVTETLFQGLNDIDQEYPGSILLTRKEGEGYGT